jgi:glycosyltransferase involved in cell wall biosynthesis
MHIGINALSVIPGATGGGETYLTNLVRALSTVDSTNRYTLVVGPENREQFRVGQPNFRQTTVSFALSRRMRRVLCEHLELPRIVAAAGVDVLYCPGNTAPAATRCALVLGVQSMLHYLTPDDAGRLRTFYFRWTLPRSARRADRIIAVSEDIKQTLLRAADVSESKVRVVHEGADGTFQRPPDGQVKSDLAREGMAPGYVLFVSTLKPYKNADKLIRAMAWMKQKRGQGHRLVVIGRDPLGLQGSLASLAQSLGIGPEVRFLGGVDHARLPSFYAGAAAFAYPSAVESFGLPILEAMACGTPVIASDRAAVPEIVGEAGMCVNPDDIPAFAEGIRRLLTDEPERERLRRLGSERAGQFTWERAARETLTVFEEAYNAWRCRRGR